MINVKRAWWQKFIQESPYNVGVDCAILMNPQTWVASGHLGSFSDPLMDCKECHERFRADKIIEDFSQENGIELESSVDGWSQEEMMNFIKDHNVPCPTCGKHNFTDIRQFNLMFNPRECNQFRQKFFQYANHSRSVSGSQKNSSSICSNSRVRNVKKQKYIPYVIEPSLGADRVVLAFLCSAYDEEVLDAEKNDVRTVLHFHPALAPVKIGVLPLSKKLNEGAEKIYQQLSKKYNCEYDDRGNIGKRYRRQDEIGTPFCVTYDFESENDGAVTIRDRDTMEQVRVKIDELDAYFADKFTF